MDSLLALRICYSAAEEDQKCYSVSFNVIHRSEQPEENLSYLDFSAGNQVGYYLLTSATFIQITLMQQSAILLKILSKNGRKMRR